MKLIKFTPEGLTQLKAKAEELKMARPAAVKELTRAREMGDLSENGLYTAAKGRLRSMDSQLTRIENQIKLAQVVVSKKFIVEQNGEKVEYQIVGDYEANPSEKKISSFSPIGRTLIGRKVGDIVSIQTPKGELKLKILEVI